MRYRHLTSTRQDEIKVLPMDTHLKLHASQLKQLTQTQTYPLHNLNAYLRISVKKYESHNLS